MLAVVLLSISNNISSSHLNWTDFSEIKKTARFSFHGFEGDEYMSRSTYYMPGYISNRKYFSRFYLIHARHSG